MTPDDVYALVDARTGRTFVMMLLVLAAVGLQIVAKLFIWKRVTRLLRKTETLNEETRTLNRETKLLVRAAETHGKLTDTSSARAESLVSQAIQVADEAKAVAAKVAPLATHDDASQILKAVERAPKETSELTAEELMRRLCAEDGLKKLLGPVVLLGAMAGSAFAAGRADAAEELRAANARAAVAWAADSPGSP